MMKKCVFFIFFCFIIKKKRKIIVNNSVDFFGGIMCENYFWFVLSSVHGLGINGLIKIYKKSRAIGINANEIALLSPEDLSNDFDIELDTASRITKNFHSAELKKMYELMKSRGIKILMPEDVNYPKKIYEIYKYPPLLYVKGNAELLNKPAIGISGSRKAGEQGKKYSYELAKKATKNSLVVVSGFARGVDEYAHYGSVSNGGETIIILPTGMYTHWNKNAVFENEESCCTISMFFPTMKFSKWTALTRNHLIACLSDLIFIVEADKPSGSYMQGKISLKFGKPTFVFQRNYKGNIRLIEKGAVPVKINTVDKIFNYLEFFFPSINFTQNKYEVTEIWEVKAV